MARLLVVVITTFMLMLPVVIVSTISLSRGFGAYIVLGFVFLFSILLSCFTEMEAQEIFVGTATYCAVIVTFIGNLQAAGHGVNTPRQ